MRSAQRRRRSRSSSSVEAMELAEDDGRRYGETVAVTSTGRLRPKIGMVRAVRGQRGALEVSDGQCVDVTVEKAW